MKFQDSLYSWKTSMMDLAIKFLPVEPQQRTKLNSIASFTLHLLEYLIILTIVTIPNQHIIQINPTWTMILVLQMLRMSFNLFYIVSKNKIFLCLKTCTLFINCLFPPEQYSIGFLPMIAFDVISCFVWALTLQQKNVHFDSRLFLKNGFFKKLICAEFVIIWLSMRFYFRFSVVIHFLFCISLFVLDFTDHIYYRKFKKMLVTLDLCLIISAVLPALYECLFEKLKFQQHLLLLVIYLIVSFSYSYISPHSYHTLYSIDPYARKFEQNEILEYFITFMELIEVENEEQKINYIVHHVRKCHQVDCLLKYHHFRSKEKDNYEHKQILRLFIKQQLICLARKYATLQDLLIYNYYDRNQIYNKYLQSNSFFHRREQLRFFQNLKENKRILLAKQQKQNKKQPQIESPQTSIQVSIVPQIQEFIKNSLVFWEQLSEYNVDCTKLLKTGTGIIKIYNNIEDILKSGVDLVQKSRVIANQYKTYLLGQKQVHHKYKFKIEHNISGFVQAVPTIIVSAQKQTFLSVVDVNTAAIKATGYSKSQLRKLTIDQFWDKQIRQDHIKLAQKRANYIAYMSQPLKTYVFLKNKFGYIVLTDAKVYYLNDLTGKKWCVVMDPYLENEAALVFNFRRQLLGVTEQCPAKGIDKTLEGKIMKLNIFNECINSKKSIKVNGKQLFQQDEFTFPCKSQESAYLKFQTQIYFNGKPCYYVITVNKRKEISAINSSPQNRYSESSLMSRRSSGISKNSFMGNLAKIKIEGDQVNLSNFEFNYDWKSKALKGKKLQPELHDQSYQKRHQSEQDQVHITQRDSEIQFVKQDSQIIQMRLWHGKLDFIENMQSVNVNFESLPQFNIEGLDTSQQRVRQQFSARMSKIPKNLIYLRVFFIILIAIVITLVMFIEIGGMRNQSKLLMQLQSNKLIFDQLDMLLSLSTQIIASNYDNTLNTQQIIHAKTLEIEQIYIKMQSKVDQFSQVIADYQTQSYNLKKADDIYRLLIKNYMNNKNSKSLNEILSHFLSQIYVGWQNILIQLNKNTNKQNMELYYAIFICIVIALMIALLIVFAKLKSQIQISGAKICKVFIGIQHKQIIGQIARLKSFKNYIDFGQTLLDDQSLSQIKQQQNSQIIHKKRIVHRKKYNLQFVLVGLTLSALILCAGIVSFSKCFIQSMYLNHMNLIHNMYYSTVKVNVMWMELNIFPRNYAALSDYNQNFFGSNRMFEHYLLKSIQQQYITEQTKQYLVNYTVGDICKFQENTQNCTFNFNGTRKQGANLLNSIYVRQFSQAISINASEAQFGKSVEAQQIYRMIDQYYSKIGRPVTDVIQKEHEAVARKKIFSNTNYVIVLAVAIVFGIISYFCTAKRIRQVNQLEKILHYVKFQVIKNNIKYAQFLIENKVLRR